MGKHVLLVVVALITASAAARPVSNDVKLVSVTAVPARMNPSPGGGSLCPVNLTVTNDGTRKIRTWYSYDGGGHKTPVTLRPGENQVSAGVPSEWAGRKVAITLGTGASAEVAIPEPLDMTIFLVQHVPHLLPFSSCSV